MRTKRNPLVETRRLMGGILEAFQKDGLRFTMDDVSRDLGMSKKTMYNLFHTKEEMFICMVNYVFDSVKEAEESIFLDPTLTTLEKIKGILKVLPEGFEDINLEKLYDLRRRYPTVYAHVEERLETGWGHTMELLRRGQREGVIRKDVSLPIIKCMYGATLEQFFQKKILIANGMTYQEGFAQMVDIILRGIVVKNEPVETVEMVEMVETKEEA